LSMRRGQVIGDRLRRSGIGKNIRISVAALSMAAAATLFYFAAGELTVTLPSFEEVRGAHSSTELLLLDRRGEVIHELRADQRARRLGWTPLEEISPALQSAIIRAEDRRFYEHGGVDWASLANALRALFSSANPHGASTITMQLVSKLNVELQPRRTRRSWRQKFDQIRAARLLEKRWPKDGILEAYLNLVTFRGELQGIAAASSGLFSKKPHGIDHLESPILAALVRSPNAGIEQVGERAAQLGAAMNLPLDRAAILSKTRETLSHPYWVAPQTALAPHVALELLSSARTRAGAAPPQIRSTLDGQLQRFAIDALRRHLESVRSQNVHDGAVLVVENRTGDVLAYVGNPGEQASARFVDGVRAPRQAGSTLKPFIYGLAFERRHLTPASLIEDSALDIRVPGGIYRPSNYDNQFHGIVTVRMALAASLNVPAVKTLNLLGIGDCVELLRRLGFENLREADHYGPSLALGSADVTLWDLANAYRALANGGLWSRLRLRLDEEATTPRRVLSPEAVFLVADILSDREGRNLTFSLESPLSTRFWSAVKTGTSKDMRDNWCVGFSDRYTVGVWAGNFRGDPMWDVSGVTGAAPAWAEIMSWLHRSQSSRAPKPPPGLTAQGVNIAAVEQNRREWFIRGTETSLVTKASGPVILHIVYPADGTIMALDPDIPPEDQKLFFEAQPEAVPLRWILDGRPLDSAESLCLWSPVAGKHTLSLADEAGRTLDTVAFEVRGNSSGPIR
jgi:penicillin-binding protein 1C